MKAHIKIEIIVNNKTEIITDQEIDLVKKYKSYFFSIDNEVQELVIEKNKLSIIRPEATIQMELNRVVTNFYKNKVQNLVIHFLLKKLNVSNNLLEFKYALMESKDSKNIMQLMKVEINY